jgi:hypothetical protein
MDKKQIQPIISCIYTIKKTEESKNKEWLYIHSLFFGFVNIL